MPVRIATADCLMDMMEFAPFLYTSELENMASLCFRLRSSYSELCFKVNNCLVQSSGGLQLQWACERGEAAGDADGRHTGE